MKKTLLAVILFAALATVAVAIFSSCRGEEDGISFTSLFETECDDGDCRSVYQGDEVTVEVFYKGGNPSRDSRSYYSFFDNRSPNAPDLSPRRLRCDSDYAPQLPVEIGERLKVTGIVTSYDTSPLGSEEGTAMVIMDDCSYMGSGQAAGTG